MRKELNTIEKIERYLQGSMPADERSAFENEINTNPQLKAEVELQKQLMRGLKNIELKNVAKKSYTKYKLGKGLKKWGGIGGSVLIITTATYFAWNYFSATQVDPLVKISYELPELNENGEKNWADADKYLPYQIFSIDNSKDTVVETQDGIVMAVPAGCFLNADGSVVNGRVELEVKEAIENDDILMSGLSTRSGNTVLETGGMFYLNARKDGENLKIDANKGIVTQVPANEIKPGMQVYEGKRMPDGSIDWVAPKPLEKFLLPVNINTLNFYPPEYEDSLMSMKPARAGDKIYKDSLYYSFARLFNADSLKPVDLKEVETDNIDTASVIKNVSLHNFDKDDRYLVKKFEIKEMPESKYEKKFDEMSDQYPAKLYDVIGYSSRSDILKEKNLARNVSILIYRKKGVGINPAKVKAIWDNKFNNTILATKEFEQRMKAIHESCNNAILDLYVNNLDKKLCTIDSMAAELDERFMAFAHRGEGRVQVEKQGHIEKLKKYYEKKQKAYTLAAAETEKAFSQKQQKVREKFENVKSERVIKDIQRKTENFKKEYDLNLKEAKRQLGMNDKAPVNPGRAGAYTVTVTVPGWKNIDREVMTATTNRTTLNYTDPFSGLKAKIEYEEVNIIVKEKENYDAVFVYGVPDYINSFMRFKNENGVFSEKLNSLLYYEMVCVAYKGEQAYFSYTQRIEPGQHQVSLAAVSKKELQQKLKQIKQYGNQQKITDELAYRYVEQKENIRQKQVKDLLDFRQRIEKVIFPCGNRLIPMGDSTAAPTATNGTTSVNNNNPSNLR